jgi:hypothetical protein
MTNGAALVAFVENALEIPIHEVEHLIAHSPDLVSRRAGTVIEQLTTSWSTTSLAEVQALVPAGELWPVAPLSLGDPKETALRLYGGWMQIQRSHVQSTADAVTKAQLQVQGLLLYSHGLFLANPLHRDPGYDPSNLDEREFMLAIGEIARLAPLLEHGVISVFDAPADEFDWLNDDDVGASFRDLREQAEELLAATGLRSVQQTAVANVLIDRVVWQISQHAAGIAERRLPTFFFDEPLERALFERIATVLSEPLRSGVEREDELRLRNLIDLRLPGVSSIRLKDMVHVREDDAFGVFRTDMTSALNASREALDRGDTEIARTIVREHMRSGAAKLREDTARGKIGEAVRSDSIAWLVGAAVATSTAGLTAAAAVLLAKLGLDAAQTPRSTAALKAHYVALAKPHRADDRNLRLGDQQSIVALSQSRRLQRDTLLRRLGEELVHLMPGDPAARPEAFADACQQFYEAFGADDCHLLAWTALQGWTQLLELDLDSPGVVFSAERLAMVGALAASDCFDGYWALVARPALNWLLLQATSGEETSVTTEQLHSLNDLSRRWLRWYLDAS